MSIAESSKTFAQSVLTVVSSPVTGDPLPVFEPESVSIESIPAARLYQCKESASSSVNWALTAPVRAVATPLVVGSEMGKKAYQQSGLLEAVAMGSVGLVAGSAVGVLGAGLDVGKSAYNAISAVNGVSAYAASVNQETLTAGFSNRASLPWASRVAYDVLNSVAAPVSHPVELCSTEESSHGFEGASREIKKGINSLATGVVVAVATPVSTALGLAQASAQKGVLGMLAAPAAAAFGGFIGACVGTTQAAVMALKTAYHVPIGAGLRVVEGSALAAMAVLSKASEPQPLPAEGELGNTQPPAKPVVLLPVVPESKGV